MQHKSIAQILNALSGDTRLLFKLKGTWVDLIGFPTYES